MFIYLIFQHLETKKMSKKTPKKVCSQSFTSSSNQLTLTQTPDPRSTPSRTAARLGRGPGAMCGITFLRLLKPVEYYQEKYGTPHYALTSQVPFRESGVRARELTFFFLGVLFTPPPAPTPTPWQADFLSASLPKVQKAPTVGTFGGGVRGGG